MKAGDPNMKMDTHIFVVLIVLVYSIIYHDKLTFKSDYTIPKVNSIQQTEPKAFESTNLALSIIFLSISVLAYYHDYGHTLTEFTRTNRILLNLGFISLYKWLRSQTFQ